MENSKQLSLPIILKGDNYLLWSRITKTALCSRGLWDHINGTQSVSSKDSEKAKDVEGEGESSKSDDSKWFQEDQLVLAILQSSLEQSILAAYSYCETAKDLWNTLKGVYGNISNLSRIYEVKKALNSLQQEERSFTQLFGDFRSLWAELETLRPPTTDPIVINERREQDQVFGLLSTLNSSFNGLIRHILRADKLPSLNEVCMQIQKEEGSTGLFGQKAALTVVNKADYKKGDRSKYVCEHCKKKGHTKDRCWILNPHLKPTKVFASVATNDVEASDVMRKSDLESLIKSIVSLKDSGNASLALKSHKPIIVDSGASHHMISDANLMDNIKPATGNVIIANGHSVPVNGVGDLKLFNKDSKAFYMPKFTSNLLSVQKATKDLDCLAIFSANDLCFQDIESGQTIGKGSSKNGLYVLEDLNPLSPVAVANNSVWHARLGHPHTKALKILFPEISFDHEKCEACILGKHCKSVFPNSSTIYKDCFELIHSDVWTAPCASRDQNKYFVTFIDEKSKYTWLTLLPSKGRVFEAFSNFHSYVSTQFNAKIKTLRTDNGGEYTSNEFKAFTSKHGIVHQTSCPYTPQQNGVAERKNRHLMEVARTMMFYNNVPKHYWGDAVSTACYLINRLPTKCLNDISPYEVLNKIKPSINFLKVFGCVCYVHVPADQRNKLEPKSIKCIFIGYSPTQKGYKCYNPETRRVYVSRDVKFDEQNGFFEEKNWDKLKDLTSKDNDYVSSLKFLLESLNLPKENKAEEVHPQSESENGDNEMEHIENQEDHQNQNDSSHEGHLEGHGTLPNDSESDSDTKETAADSEGDNPIVDIEETAADSGIGTEETAIHEHDSPIQLRRSARIRKDPSNWVNTRVYYNNMAVSHPIQAYCSFANLPADHYVFLSKIDQDIVPKNFSEANLKDEWNKAMREEAEAMNKNNTWEVVDLPKDKKPVGSRWVYTIKYQSNGDIERYKARLVAKGFTQTYGEDYQDTFAPVAKLHTVRVVLSLATNFSWDLWQMDVKNAFLQGELEEEVYMLPPPGLIDEVPQGKVFKLNKAIYGLKQSPRAWYHKLSSTLRDKGFKRSEADHSLFTIQGETGIVIVLIYVDDIIISGNDKEGIKSIKSFLKTVFDIKDLGELKYFLGIEVCRSDEGLFISQRKYTLDLLSETGKLGAKPAKTPIEDGYKDCRKGEPEGELFSNIGQYQRIVGKLIYLTITRPDLCFSVNQVSQHMQAPTIHHWNMVERILKYLKGTPGKGIWMQKNGHAEIVGYCDADWAGDRVDRKSTSGYCTFVGGNLVTWKSKKQKVVSRSSAEAEYRSMANTTDELIWLKALLLDLGFKTPSPIIMHCDNQAAIHIASNSVFHERTKHIEVDCHHIREKVELGIISPTYTKSSDQLADIFTKAANSKVCNFIHGKLGLIDIHQPSLRGNVEINALKS